MPRISSFQKSIKDIKAHFDSLPSKIFTSDELIEIFEKNKEKWKLAKSITDTKFLESLVKYGDFGNVLLDFRNIRVNKFFYKNTSVLALASRITNRSYLSHYSSLSLHGLTEQIPKVLYVTQELTQKVSKEVNITQEAIDRSFAKEQRDTSNVQEIMGYKIYLLEGKHSQNLGVTTDFDSDSGELIKFTDLERTMIDIVVRPNYAGGVYEVLKAYKAASPTLSINRLNAMLNKLNYIYPYHQAIGFYLEKSGSYKDSVLKLLQRKEMKYDFYLTYGMKQIEYSDKWKIYYPKDL